MSLGFGPWGEQAGQRLKAAAIEGKLVIYVFAKPQVRSEDHSLTDCSLEKIEPVAVPVNVVKRLIASRGGLPDHPIRPSIKTAEGNEKLFALLAVGLLVVRANDFDAGINRNMPRVGGRHKGRKRRKTEDLRSRRAPLETRSWHSSTITNGAAKTPSRRCIACSLPPAVPRFRARIRLHVWSTSCTAKRVKQGFCASPAHAVSNL